MNCRRDHIAQKIRKRTVMRDCGHATLCWVWSGPTSGNGRGGGYPRMSLDGQTVAVHIVMFTNQHGYVPVATQIDHLCRNRLCVNPEHLELVTHKQNMRRRDLARDCREAAE